ncbi:hypothetical protein FNV43_RR21143 [Rhamnella rubrinervis]|uniref:DUF4408 domain-containing protein n=1 Tax=Rhamnella rubrinervis TaxID=2594499 RepID=A0A8K0DXC0_9ROSA|nr:hypothetical protein FNV43_RR21143 [Rhamnella rubrinervis]
MADLFQTKRLQMAIWVSKMLLVMVGMFSTLTLLKVAVIPYLVNLTLSTVPDLWISIRSCLSPLYMYIIVNFIIITIAASSTFQHHPNQKQFPSTMTKKKSDKIEHGSEKNRPQIDDQLSWNSFQFIIEEEEEEQIKKPNSTEPPPNSIISPPDVVDISFNDDPLPETHSGENTMKDSGEKPAEKPKEDENDEDDTLEGTWKAIMEGQGKAKARQLKKSDTWDVPPRVVVGTKPEVENDPADWARRELKKSETYSDRVTVRMRDKSMSQEELYERAEDFIKKFNRDMRLQRQESDQRFMEMVNRGV